MRLGAAAPNAPGDILQIDTLTVTPKHGRPTIKQFNAVDPVAKWAYSQAFRSATAKNGREFPGKVAREMPFEAEAIQIDGGSEFKAEFKAECEARSIELWVLPPRPPELNGCVERTNGTWRYEFHGC